MINTQTGNKKLLYSDVAHCSVSYTLAQEELDSSRHLVKKAGVC